MTLSYVLRIVTIAITLGLGLIAAYQNKKLQHGQNIIAVTTNYRSKHSEQLRECFKLKCDLYISAEWDRIKRETKGRDTSSESWIEFHEKISEKFSDLFAEIDEKYAPKKVN